MFADDLKIYNKSFNNDIVQMDINNMLKWSSIWCLYFNTNKCSVLYSGEKNTDCDYFMSIGEVDYKINNSQLVKDLGVTFDSKLNFNHHIYEITHKATKILGILKRTFIFFNKKIFLLLYKSLTILFVCIIFRCYSSEKLIALNTLHEVGTYFTAESTEAM